MTETIIRIEIAVRYGTGDNRRTRGVRRDHAGAEWNGRHFEAVSRHGATMKLARALVEAGCPDRPWEAGRPGKRDMFGPSLHRLAGLTVREVDEGPGPRFARWTPHGLFGSPQDEQDGAEAPGSSGVAPRAVEPGTAPRKPKRRRLPRSPEEEHVRWLPPGERKDTPPPPVPAKIWRDPRQSPLDLPPTAPRLAE